MGIEPTQLANLRVDYSLKSFDEKDRLSNPFLQFANWFEEALTAEVNEPNAMTLATVKPNGLPSARIVLLKGFDEAGFVFFTNYNSHKGKQIAQNPNVAIVFCWLELQRQVRIEGRVSKISDSESTQYFLSRPLKSQLGAHASNQSEALKDRAELEKNYLKMEELFLKQPMVKPDNWGGFKIEPHTIEFWQGRQSRLHDRFEYTLNANAEWDICRLAP